MNHLCFPGVAHGRGGQGRDVVGVGGVLVVAVRWRSPPVGVVGVLVPHVFGHFWFWALDPVGPWVGRQWFWTYLPQTVAGAWTYWTDIITPT